VKLNNSAAALRNCRRAWRSPRNPLVAHLAADAGPKARQPFSRLSAHFVIDSPLEGAKKRKVQSLSTLSPVYVRGEAYLAAHQGNESAAEFQKILNWPGVVINEPIAALAHLQIGRAYAMQGDTAKAKAAYQDFLTLWKDADPDIPIFVAAKAEYAKLQ
jgi:tetratricopeptide (TPR) repeat protein